MSLAYALAAHFAEDSDAPVYERGAREFHSEALSDDAALLAHVAEGDSAAFEVLFRRYRGALCDFAARYTRSRETAEDIVHDILLWVWQHAREITLRGSVRGYLFGAVRHRALDLAERQAVSDRVTPDEIARMSMAVMEQTDVAAERADLRAAVGAAIATLTERRRAVIILRWGHQLSFAEIAQALGVSVRTAETTHLRAMDDLRQRLAGQM